MLLLTGCGDKDPGKKEIPTTITFSDESIKSDVLTIIRDSRSQSEPYTHQFQIDQDTVWEKEGRRPIPTKTSPLPSIELPSVGSPSPLPIGTLLLKLSDKPNSMAINNQGGVIYATEKEVVYYLTKHSAFSLLETPASWVQFDEKGERLLVQYQNNVYILSGENYSEKQTLSEVPSGKVYWGTEEDQLLIVHESISMDPSLKQRVAIELYLYDLKTETFSPHDWKPLSTWSALGTLPTLGKMWGHFSQPHLINAIPAKLAMIENGVPTGFYTDTDSAADILPCADNKGNFLWIRSYGYGSSSGRAWIRNLDDEKTPQWQITAEPTYQVAISPSGDYLGLCTLNNSTKQFEIRKSRVAFLEQNVEYFKFFQERDQSNRQKALEMEKKIVQFFSDAITENPTLSRVEFKEPPTQEMVRASQKIFAKYLKENFLLSIPPGIEGLMVLDLFITQAGAYIGETPPVILAVAGYFADAMSPDGKWMLDQATVNLSSGEIQQSSTDSLSYTAVLPFLIAQEAMAGRLSLAETALDLRASSKKPVYFVENLNADTLVRITETEWIRAGLSPTELNPEKLIKVIASGKATSPVNLFSIDIGHDYELPDVSMQAALNLAKENPTSAQAMSLLASELVTQYKDDLAIDVLTAAIHLDPFDSYLYLTLGDSHTALNSLEEAEKFYLQARELDITETYSSVLTGRFELLEKLARRNNTTEEEIEP